MVFKVDLRYITYHSHIIKTDQSIQVFRETLLEKRDKPMRKRWIKRFAVVALATAVFVYTVPKTGLLAALGLSQTTEAEEASSDQKGPGGTSFGVSDYSAVNKLTSDAVLDGQTITSTGTDENAVNVSEGANVTVKNSTVSRESSDSTGGDHHKPGYLRWHSCSRWRHTSRMECNRRNQRSVLCGNPERSWRRHNGSGGWNIYF